MSDQQPLRCRLTAIEMMILDGLAGGKTGVQLCHELCISRSLYQIYLRLLRRSLGVKTTIEAVALWVREGGR